MIIIVVRTSNYESESTAKWRQKKEKEKQWWIIITQRRTNGKKWGNMRNMKNKKWRRKKEGKRKIRKNEGGGGRTKKTKLKKKTGENKKSYQNGARTDAPKPLKRTRVDGAFMFFFVFSMGGPETTRKIVLSGQDQKNTPETPNSSKFTKTPRRGLSNCPWCFFGDNARPWNPYFRSVSWGSQKWGSINHPRTASNGVQLITLGLPAMGFNYATVGIYIYICWRVSFGTTFLPFKS